MAPLWSKAGRRWQSVTPAARHTGEAPLTVFDKQSVKYQKLQLDMIISKRAVKCNGE